MCQQFRFDNKSQFRVFLAKLQKAADLKLKGCTTISTTRRHSGGGPGYPGAQGEQASKCSSVGIARVADKLTAAYAG